MERALLGVAHRQWQGRLQQQEQEGFWGKGLERASLAHVLLRGRGPAGSSGLCVSREGPVEVETQAREGRTLLMQGSLKTFPFSRGEKDAGERGGAQ